MVKLIISDLDGTLLQSTSSVSNYTKDIINKLREKGILFTVATGRSPKMIQTIIDDLQLKTPIITSNGCVVIDPKTRQMIKETFLSKQEVLHITNYLNKIKTNYLIFTKTKIITQDTNKTREFENMIQSFPKEYQTQFIFHDTPSLLLDDTPIEKIVIQEQDKDKYNSTYHYITTNSTLKITKTSETLIDINPSNTSKGDALKTLLKTLNISSDEVVAFGDQMNDIEMLQAVTTSVAVANATKEVKEITTHHTLSNNQDGVAKWIEENILDEE